MTKKYIEYKFTILPLAPGGDILIAQLADCGFESFLEEGDQISAYITRDQDSKNILSSIPVLQSPDYKISYKRAEIIERDWNSKWESEFQPVRVGDQCVVRASFHPKSDTRYDIVINPKMAFGTGHHPTTYLMIKQLLELDINNKEVLDMGCGTGVLSILAKKRGAQAIDAIDIDPWCYENTIKNSVLNDCLEINVFKGDSSLLKDRQYHLILANINRNILLKDIQNYSDCLLKDGTLLLSGFYEKDLDKITGECEKNGLAYDSHKSREEWVAARFKKA